MLDEHDAEGAVSVGHGGEGERSAIDGDIALGNEIGEKISLLELEDDAEGVAVGDVALDDCGSIDMALGARGMMSRYDTGWPQLTWTKWPPKRAWAATARSRFTSSPALRVPVVLSACCTATKHQLYQARSSAGSRLPARPGTSRPLSGD